MKFKVTDTESGQRLDQFLANHLTDKSRSQIQKIIIDGQVSCSEKTLKKNYRVELDDLITVKLKNPEPTSLKGHTSTLEIIHEEEDFVVINKPPGLPVHPDLHQQHHKVTLINVLVGNKIPLSTLGGKLRPGIVHRIDKDTSGLLIIAKTDHGYKNIRQQFENHQIEKTYLCLNIGHLDSKMGRIEAPLARDPRDRKKIAVQSHKDAKHAVSEFKILETFISPQLAGQQVNLLEVKIPTGRTHQIRVHFASISHPLIGDTTYGNSKINTLAKKYGLKRQFLHAYRLKFKSPTTGKALNLTAPLPEDLEIFMNNVQ